MKSYRNLSEQLEFMSARNLIGLVRNSDVCEQLWSILWKILDVVQNTRMMHFLHISRISVL
jgi:hypothetical protein